MKSSFFGTLFIIGILCSCQRSQSEATASTYKVLPGLSLAIDSAVYIKDRNNSDVQILRVSGHWIGRSPADAFKISINFPEPFSQKPPVLRSWYTQGPAEKITDAYCPVSFEIKGPLPMEPAQLLVSLEPLRSQSEKKSIIIDVPRFETSYIDGVPHAKTEQGAAANP